MINKDNLYNSIKKLNLINYINILTNIILTKMILCFTDWYDDYQAYILSFRLMN